MGHKERVGYERFLGEKGTLLKAIGASGSTRKPEIIGLCQHAAACSPRWRPFAPCAFRQRCQAS